MDDIDIAQAQDEKFREMSLLEHASRKRNTGASLKTCCVCGDDIPERRRLAVPGCIKCISCQEEFEFMHGR
jgi:phage/conjugal plasmid C-4 type zinc finger TraR family protein